MSEEVKADTIDPSEVVPTRAKHTSLNLLEKYGLALAPALVYFLCYTYESAYCGVWKLPKEFIQIEIPTILYFCSAILGLGILLPLLFDSILQATSVRDGTKNHFARAATLHFPAFVLIILIFVITGFDLVHRSVNNCAFGTVYAMISSWPG